MKTLSQKLATQLPEIFSKEPPKKLLQSDPQKWSSRKKTTLAALTTFLTLGAGFLTYRYSSQKINIPHSAISSPINTALKVVGSLTALVGLGGLLAYNPTNQTNITQKYKSNTEGDNTQFAEIKRKENPNFVKKTSLISSSSTPSQTKINKNQNTNETTGALSNTKPNPTHADIEKLFIDFHAGEKINKDLLEELITTYINLSTTSPKATIKNEIFIDYVIRILHSYQYVFFNDIHNLNQEKSNLNKMIDISDFFIDRTDPLSGQLVKKLFFNIIPNDLDGMTSMITSRAGNEDKESQELVKRSCEIGFKALAQQMEILFSDGTNCKTEAFNRMSSFLPPFKNFFRIYHNYYATFTQFYPKLAWKFVQKYIFEYMINLSPETITTNAEAHNDDEDEISPYTSKDCWDVLNSIVISAKLSLFLDVNEGAASFAIRLMQHKLGIDPKEFEKSYPDKNRDLKYLYFDLCNKKDLKLFKNLAKKYEESNEANQIANALINECRTAFRTYLLFGTDVTKFHETFLDIIIPLSQKKESEKEKKTIKRLSHFINSQILDPSIPQRAELASLALNKFPEVFQDEYLVKLITNAYETSQLKENTELGSACQKFLTTWDTLQEKNSNIQELQSDIKNLK